VPVEDPPGRGECLLALTRVSGEQQFDDGDVCSRRRVEVRGERNALLTALVLLDVEMRKVCGARTDQF
jgi:hypothetical protein